MSFAAVLVRSMYSAAFSLPVTVTVQKAYLVLGVNHRDLAGVEHRGDSCDVLQRALELKDVDHIIAVYVAVLVAGFVRGAFLGRWSVLVS